MAYLCTVVGAIVLIALLIYGPYRAFLVLTKKIKG